MKRIDDYVQAQSELCRKSGDIKDSLYSEYGVKRGLRDLNGQGVLTGLTNISKVTAFTEVNGERVPCPGELLYRGYDVKDLVKGALTRRFVYEEAA